MPRCRNCQVKFAGNYCGHCGQKAFNEQDKSVRSILLDAFHFVTSFDGKLWYSLKTIYRQPGKYSTDYASGIRIRYYKPIALFLLIAVAYIIFPLFDGLNMELKYYEANPLTGQLVKNQISEKIASESITYAEISREFATKSAAVSKIFLFLLIPLSVPMLRLFSLRKKRWLYDDFLVATEINIFYVLTIFILLPFILMVLNHLFANSFTVPESTIMIVISLIFLIYLTLLFRKIYQWKTPVAVLAALLFGLFHSNMIQFGYKFILFELTFALV